MIEANNETEHITKILGCKRMNVPIKYLGLPLGAKFNEIYA